MPCLAKILADQGHHLIIDEVLFGHDLLKDYVNLLKSHTVYFIGVFCDLSIMQEREILRRDRVIGLSIVFPINIETKGCHSEGALATEGSQRKDSSSAHSAASE
ncbi:MAG: hypothetical protein JW855_02845 [Gammaproteobacteria bacterium]|nr:hypothetical protein [Gammaproteobacteria bacterium]